ncbi:MAG: helix-turn-helix domain-containing protein [Rhodobacteraceae bacterium]|jgi:AraC-like DNA-binding protein|nr:AraC family transcriptional regulator [Alphaproteobacteria bacterium]NNF71678.1 helix-turn-helix domain-containing protein [Paracoccaceae bacterium]NNK67994.1 helix-turn-helix domain-containing protein [Paracoccaceae bacterium]
MLQLRDPDAGYRITSMQRLAAGGRWHTEAMRSYGRPMLYWFTRGQGKITISGSARGYGPNNVVFLPTGTMHGFSMLGHVQGTALHIPRALASEFPDTALHLRLRNKSQQAEMAAMIDALERENAGQLAGCDRAMAHHAGLIAIWLERNADLAERPHDNGAAARLSTAFTALLERDFRTGANVSSYAAKLGVTPTHLSRACREASGRSASRLIADRVHFEARKLLTKTDLPVNEIARQLGFGSPAYFTRAFQSETGATPTAFRRAG